MSTPSLSADQLARARKIEQLVLQRLAEMLAVLGLKVVPTEVRCFDERDIEAVLHQAKRWMEHIQNVDQLEFD